MRSNFQRLYAVAGRDATNSCGEGMSCTVIDKGWSVLPDAGEAGLCWGDCKGVS